MRYWPVNPGNHSTRRNWPSASNFRSRSSPTNALTLTRALRLPTMEVADRTLIKRLTIVVEEGSILIVFYPVFPPDRHAREVLAWLRRDSAQ